jgi:hypothetical protein
LNHAPSGLNVWQGPAVDDLLFVKQLKFQCTEFSDESGFIPRFEFIDPESKLGYKTALA